MYARQRSWSAMAVLLLAMPAASAAQGFEGVTKQRTTFVMPQGVSGLAGADTSSTDPGKVLAAVTSKLDGADPSLARTMEMTSYVKGKKMRAEGGMGGIGGGAYMVLDAATDSIYMVMPAMAQVLVGTVAEMAAIQKKNMERAGMGDVAAMNAGAKVTDLGESTVGGVRAHGYRVSTAAMVAESWVDPSQPNPDLGALMGMSRRMSGTPGDSVLEAATGGKGRVLRALSIMKAPAVMGAGWLVLRIEVDPPLKQPVADSVFAVPAEYTRMKVADMMPQM